MAEGLSEADKRQLMINLVETYESSIKALDTLGFCNDADILYDLQKNMMMRLIVLPDPSLVYNHTLQGGM